MDAAGPQEPKAPFWLVMVVEETLCDTLTVYVIAFVLLVTIVFAAMPVP